MKHCLCPMSRLRQNNLSVLHHTETMECFVGQPLLQRSHLNLDCIIALKSFLLMLVYSLEQEQLS